MCRLGYTAQLRRGRVSLPDLNVVVYSILRNLIEIVILLYLLVYNFALFSKFAPLTLANFEKAWFGLDNIELAKCRLLGQLRL